MLLLLLSLLLPAQAAPAPLVQAADVADRGLHGWWKEGALLLGHPAVEGRPGVRPLAELEAVVLPTDLSSWAEVGATCVAEPQSRVAIDGRELVARVTATAEGPVIQVLDGQRVVAHNALGRPARVCEVLLAQADALPGVEVVVAWRMEIVTAQTRAEPAALEGQEPPDDAELRGFTIYRLPEAAR